jgi:Secretion system C-terminal sorting domain
MKKIILFILINLITITTINAQKEYWGVNIGGIRGTVDPYMYLGNITKYDVNGENPVLVHEFNGANGFRPEGKLFQASNGKLYGTTLYGGNNFTSSASYFGYGYGVLYEYDLVLNKYRLLKNFTLNSNVFIREGFQLIEPIPGILYSTEYNKIFKYDIASNNLTILPNSFNTSNLYYVSGLTKASDGNLYGLAGGINFCGQQNSLPKTNGYIIKVNTTTNTVSVALEFTCTFNITGNGSGPHFKMFEMLPGKFYGILATGDGYNIPGDTTQYYRQGAIFEYNYIANTIHRKIDFIGDIHGKIPYEPIDGGDGFLYGVCEQSDEVINCTFPFDYIQPIFGTIWKYNPVTNDLSVLKKIGPTCIDYIFEQYPKSILKTSNGHIMCTYNRYPFAGLFKYNPINDIITSPAYDGIESELKHPESLIEICRKPAYQEILVNTFTANVGGVFTYDVQNTNATSYQWQLNGSNVTGQTTGVLNLSNITVANAGVYTCVMTNECGTTTTAPLTLTVNNLGTNTVAKLDKNIQLVPNPAINFITIELPKNIDVKINNLKINDMLGKEVYTSNENNTKIEVSKLPKGIYIISLQTNYGDWNGKFVKE